MTFLTSFFFKKCIIRKTLQLIKLIKELSPHKYNAYQDCALVYQEGPSVILQRSEFEDLTHITLLPLHTLW